jgi:1,4-dihydroxy-2-naphthoate octaprenyltransferase
VARAAEWVAGARPRTLPASAVPVAVGTGVAVALGQAVWWRAGCALIVSLALQIGVNYANDYSDGVKGTDAVRVGPLRLTASGLARPGAVKRAAYASFAVAGIFGLALAAAVAWWLIGVGALCIAAAWLYTGGPRPYGYAGLGEVFVFVFFGLVATVGTAYVQVGRIDGWEVLAAVPVGLLAVSLLVVNNLRDIPGDAVAGKRTLAVRLGAPRTRILYGACLAVALVLALPLAVWRPWSLLALIAAPLAVAPVQTVRRGAVGRDLIAVLGATGRAQLAFGALLALGLAL